MLLKKRKTEVRCFMRNTRNFMQDNHETVIIFSKELVGVVVVVYGEPLLLVLAWLQRQFYFVIISVLLDAQ